MSIRENLGQGGKFRKEVYEQIQEALGKDIPESTRLGIKKIMLDYVQSFQDAGLAMLAALSSDNNNLKGQIEMLQKQSHTICNKCGELRIIKKKK